MRLITILALLWQFRSLNGQALDSNFVSLDEKVLAIERLMLVPGTIDFQTAPCNFMLNGIPITSTDPNPSGDQTSAEWVRTVFHDFITADVAAGTGGLDASVGFESGRAENLGTTFDGMNFIDRTIFGFNLFSNVFISTSDFIALGLAEAVLSCDPNSPMIQLRAGRIDAKQAGPTGVPGPGDSLASQTAAFARAGFNKTDMIKAVACGHSIGGVHNTDFPNIVGSQPVHGANQIDYFDDTPFVFDNVGVQKYLSGAGKAGGPLVTTANSAFRSDLNIFESDNNATIRAMAASQAAFENACFPIFERMLNTVPAGTTLSSPIGPSKWITMEGFLDLTSTGVMLYNGTIGTYSRTGSPATASYQYNTVGGGNTGPHTSQVGVQQTLIVDQGADFTALRFPFFGNTTYYDFTDPIDSKVNSLTIQSTYTEPINQNLFIVPSMSFLNPNTGPTYFITAALLTTLVPANKQINATLFYASGQAGTFSPTYLQNTVQLSSTKTLGAYTLFQGTMVRPTPPLPVQGGTSAGSHMDVSLGSLRSRKTNVGSNIGRVLFGTCTKTNFVGC